MRETQITQPETGILNDLATFDPNIYNRIEEIQAGFSPNGEHPNGVLSDAMENPTPEVADRFMNEYGWALSLAVYPHRDKENRDVLMSAAVDALYMAGETYDSKAEPNFLRHLGHTVTDYLEEVFGPSEDTSLPSAAEFESFVLQHSEKEEMLPPLATERRATDFRIGQRILLLAQGQLRPAKIKNVVAYEEGATRFGPPTPLPADEKARRLKALRKRAAELETENKEFIVPDPELLRRAIMLRPELRTVVPDTRPGFIHARTTEGASHGVIIDMDNNGVVPFNAWRHIKKDQQYRERYLASGSPESLRRSDALEAAIDARIELERSMGQKVVQRISRDRHLPGRARLVERSPSGISAFH